MKKLIIGMLALFLVALVPSVMADLPTTNDNTVDATEDTDYVFVEADFPFTDTDGDLLASVRVTVLETVGDLKLDGVDIFVDDVVVLADITDGKLVFTPVANKYGTGYDSFEFTVIDDSVGSEESTSAVMTVDVANDNSDVPTNLGTDMPSSINEDEQITVILSATNPLWVLGDVTFDIVNQPTQGSLSGIDPVSHEVVYTPDANYYGSDQFTVKATNVEGDATLDVDVTVNRLYDDTPVLPDLDDHKLQEKLLMVDVVLPEATDADGVSDTLTYSLEVVDAPEDSTFVKEDHWNAATRILSGWEPVKDDVGELKLRLTATDSQDLTDSEEFSLHVYPKYMCEDGEVGGYLVVTLDEPEDGDDYGPGDMIKIEVTVENDASDDKDVIVEAILYNLNSHKKLVEVESDSENLDERGEDDDELTFELELQVPLDSDEDYTDDYVLYVKVYEDGEEDEECQCSMVELDISRESHEVIIQNMVISPSTVNPGETVDVSLKVLNIGKKDEDSVYVRLRSEELGIDLTSPARDLGAYDEDGNVYLAIFKNLVVPLDTEAGTFDLEAYVVFDGGSKSTDYLDSPTFRVGSSGLVVEESSMLTTTGATTVDEVEEETTVGKEFPWSTVMWITGDIVLIIVALFFLKLIFSGRKRQPEIKEVKL